ncbi:MAG: hypothetical protein AAB348_00560 [Patescibacteria group bacterium]
MPINLAKENLSPGNVVFEWVIKEYDKYDRSRRWYFVAGIFGILMLVYALFARNYLFVLIVILFGIILFMQDMQEPMEVDFAITETGLVLGNRFYPFKEFDSYYIIYNPPDVKSLYFLTKSVMRHRLQIPLFDFDPRPIREYLNHYIVEDVEKEEEPFTDRIARRFKIH